MTRRPAFVIPIIVLVLYVAVAVLAPLLAPYDPDTVTLSQRLLGPQAHHLMGTDALGRDVLTRTMYGTRVSLLVAAAAVVVRRRRRRRRSACSPAGGAAGSAPSSCGSSTWCCRCRSSCSRSSSSRSSAPASSTSSSAWRWSAGRGTRGSPTPRRCRPAAAGSCARPTAAGAPGWWIVVRHVLPEVLPVTIVVATLEFGLMVVYEASLSFLGLGVQPPTASWGSILSDGQQYIATAWWLATFPGLALFLLVLAVNLLGDAARDRLDPTKRAVVARRRMPPRTRGRGDGGGGMTVPDYGDEFTGRRVLVTGAAGVIGRVDRRGVPRAGRRPAAHGRPRGTAGRAGRTPRRGHRRRRSRHRRGRGRPDRGARRALADRRHPGQQRGRLPADSARDDHPRGGRARPRRQRDRAVPARAARHRHDDPRRRTRLRRQPQLRRRPAHRPYRRRVRREQGRPGDAHPVLALEAGEAGIRVIGVGPGFAPGSEVSELSEDHIARMTARHPAGPYVRAGRRARGDPVAVLARGVVRHRHDAGRRRRPHRGRLHPVGERGPRDLPLARRRACRGVPHPRLRRGGAVPVAQPGHPGTAVGQLEQRRYGPRRGILNLLDMMDRVGVRATVFVPGWIADTLPRAGRRGRTGAATSSRCTAGATSRPTDLTRDELRRHAGARHRRARRDLPASAPSATARRAGT